ncbi:MarR family winged helix-turn-helix transcriptional regulator [Solimonas soli]|uniref:MarR family winged helix-turn-helix transcriptional regulator n=1 Tax=Solimonas soli TaxID=413479 RepID=UPI0004AE38AF|nr:MarR family transcriptional regulator [Solimonas soli]
MATTDRPDFAQLIPPEYRGHLGFLLNKAQRALVDEIDTALGDGLAARHFAIVGVLHARPGLRQTDLAGLIGIDRTTTMKIVDELEGRGMVRRAPHAEDRRANALELTAEGRAWRERVLPLLIEQETRFLAPLSAGERTLLQELLLRLVAASFDRKHTDHHHE